MRANWAALAAGVLLVSGLAVTAEPLPAQAVELTEVDVIGGPLHAEMYPSGLDTAPNGTVVVADTGNNQVARYRADGSQVWRVGEFGGGVNQFENPRDIAVDFNNFVYVADARNNRIVKLSPTGEWVDSVGGVSVPLGVSAKGNKIYVADTGRSRVVVLNRDLTTSRVITKEGDCSAGLNGPRDAQADSAGNVYVTGYMTNQILKFAPDGTCLATWGSTGTAPGQMRTPYGVDTGVDPVTGRQLLYVAEGIGNRVQVFTLTGEYVTHFGTFGRPEQVGTFTANRRVAVAEDGTGDAWMADLWGERIQRWRREATGFSHARTIGRLTPAPTSTAAFHEPRGMAFTPSGNLLVADTVHHSFQEFTKAGTYQRTCGERAAQGQRLGLFNWPRGIAVDPVTGNLWAADTKQNQLQVLDSNCGGIGFIKNAGGGTDARAFNWPFDITIRRQGTERFAFVVDTYNHRLKAYDVAGADLPTPDRMGPPPTHVFGAAGSGLSEFSFPSGITTGPDGSIYVADSGNNRITKLSYTRAAGFARVATYNAGGTLRGPEGVAVDADGRIYVADSGNNRVVVMTSSGTLDGTITGLSHPGNLEIGPDGRLYVADTYADVVRVYRVGSGGADTTAPVGVVTAPGAGAVLPRGPVTVRGSATDNVGVAKAYVAVRRVATGRWLRRNGTYGATLVWIPATLASPGAQSSAVTFRFTPPAGGEYVVRLRVDDAAGNTNSPRPSVRFRVRS